MIGALESLARDLECWNENMEVGRSAAEDCVIADGKNTENIARTLKGMDIC